MVQTYHVCSKHFLSCDIRVNGKRKTIVPGKVPSIFPSSKNSISFENDSAEINHKKDEANNSKNAVTSQEIVDDALNSDEDEIWYLAETEFDVNQHATLNMLSDDDTHAANVSIEHENGMEELGNVNENICFAATDFDFGEEPTIQNSSGCDVE